MGVPLSVLLVEDSLADAELVLIELRAGGYDPDYQRVDTPEDMKAALERREWNVILCDYVMPRFSGPAALKLYQSLGLDVPFIMVTGQVGEETAVEAMKAGANDYVLKINLTRLVPAIQRELRDAEVRRERWRTEDALRKSEQLYRGLYQAVGAGVVMQDADGRIVEANETAQQVLGISLDQMRGLTSMDPLWAATREDGSPFPGEEHPITIARLTGQGVHNVVSGVIHADGSRRWMLVNAAPILASDTGKTVGAVATFVDITDRKRAEEELREAQDELEMRVEERTEELEATNEELLNEIEGRKLIEEEHERLLKELQFDEARWRTLVESMPELVTVCDAEGRATYVNTAQSHLFGYQVEPDLALEEHPVYYNIYHPDGTLFAPEDLPLQRAALHGEEARHVEIVLRRPDGEERITEWDAAPLRDAEDRIVGAVAVGRDIADRKRAQEDRERLLKEVEERRNLFQLVVKHAPSGIAVLRGYDLVYDMVNPAYQLFASGKEMVGRTFADVWPEAAEEQAPLLRRVLDTGEPFYALDLLIPIRASTDGPLEDRFWTYSYLRLPPDHSGQPGILSWVTETTENVRARQRVKELADGAEHRAADVALERDRLEALIASIADEIWFCDTNGNVTLANEATLRGLGFQAPEQVFQPLREVAESLEIQNPDGQPRSSEDTPLLRSLQGDVLTELEEIVRHKKTGELRYRQVSSAPVRDKDGQIVGAIAVVRDITEQKRADEERERLLTEFQGIFASIADGAMIQAPDGAILRMNPAAERMLRYTPEQMKAPIEQRPMMLKVKRPDGTLLPLEENPTIRALHGETVQGMPMVMHTLDGRKVWIVVSAAPLRMAGGRLLGAITTFTDFTQYHALEERQSHLLQEVQRRVKELDAVNKELEAFGYTLAHDLRAPLRHVDSFSKLLQRDYASRLDEEGEKYIQFVRAGSERMSQLIDDLLKLSRLTGGEMRREPVDLSEMARGIAVGLHEEQPERKADFIIPAGIVANGDPQLLRVVLVNLLANAWKFTSSPSLGRTARIEFGVSQDDGMAAYFVRDNSAGFKPALADKLFSPFQRLHREDEFPGTGIGLATVQRIVHRHGGKVWAEGEVNKGATFYFTLG